MRLPILCLRILSGVSLLALLLGLPQVAQAATTCTVTNSGLNFGSYDAVTGAAVTSSVTLTITCSGAGHTSLPVTIALNAGSNGTLAQRVMKDTASPADSLTYNLYVTTPYNATNIWGDGTSGTQTQTVTTGNTNPSATATATVLGQIDSAQDANGFCTPNPFCSYSDSVNITITF